MCFCRASIAHVSRRFCACDLGDGGHIWPLSNRRMSLENLEYLMSDVLGYYGSVYSSYFIFDIFFRLRNSHLKCSGLLCIRSVFSECIK